MLRFYRIQNRVFEQLSNKYKDNFETLFNERMQITDKHNIRLILIMNDQPYSMYITLLK